MKWGFAPPLRGPPLGAGPLDPPPMALRASGGAAAPAPPRGRVRIAGPRRPRTPRNNAGGCVPGPGAARAPPGPLGSSAALRRHQRYARRSRLSAGPFLRTPRPLLRRGPCPCAGRSGAARPPPLRGPGPAHGALASLAGPAPRGSPPAPSLGRLCAAARLRGRSLAPSGSGSGIRSGCGLPVRSPLLRSASAAPQRVAPPGPPRPVPLRGLRGRLPPAPGGPRPSAVVWWLRPPGPCCAPAPARACWCLFRAAVRAVGLSPAPPRPAAPAGGSGGHEACGRASPPFPAAPGGSPMGRASRAPLLSRGRGPGGAPRRFFGMVDSPKIVNRVSLHGACGPPPGLSL